MMDIYVSSLAMAGIPVEEMIRVTGMNHWALEFSSGLPYREDMNDIYINARVKRMPHNYFPAPETPFVLNLASQNEAIREKSVEFCKAGLRLAKVSGSPFFAAHAGFCVDPRPEELGNPIQINPGFDRAQHKALFFRSLETLLAEAERLNIPFLIENNVIASFNLLDGDCPLLCCDSREILEVFRKINHRLLGLLLDTGHLKVSAQTLGKNLDCELTELIPCIQGIHHSDNDGLSDNNKRFDESYWFWKHMHFFKNIVHVVEVKCDGIDTINDQITLLRKYGNTSSDNS